MRVSRLVESVQIIKGLFADDPVTFSGTYYTVTDLNGYPKPLQRPHPPILIAGGGKRMLSLAAREADIVGLVMQSRGAGLDFMDSTTAATAQQVAAWVRQAAGDRVDSLELNTLLFGVVVTDQRQRAAEQLASVWGITAEQVLDSIHFLVGTVDQMIEDIRMWRERFGISYFLVLPEYYGCLRSRGGSPRWDVNARCSYT